MATAAEIALITADVLHSDFGVEVLDEDDEVIETITGALVDGEVEHEAYADVHGSCTLTLAQEVGGDVRLRPYITLTADDVSQTWYLGSYLPVSPEINRGEVPAQYAIQGFDKLSLLDRQIGDTYVLDSGTAFLDAVSQMLADAGLTGLAHNVEGTDATLSDDLVWALDAPEPQKWLTAINGLLGICSYRGLWMDAMGRPCSALYRSPAGLAPVWAFDLTDPRTNIVNDERIETGDEYDRTNYWRFIRDGLAAPPAEGSGQYTVDNSGAGAVFPKVEYLSANSQADLVARGDARVEAAALRKRTIEISCGPVPILSHFDVVSLYDPLLGGTLKCQVVNWRLPLRDEDMTITLEVL